MKKLFYHNILDFHGQDDFIDVCNQNNKAYGPPNSKIRKSCLRHRKRLIEVLEKHPQQFYLLRNYFTSEDIGVHDISEQLEQLSLLKNSTQPTLPLA
jgi:hypothetical protein